MKIYSFTHLFIGIALAAAVAAPRVLSQEKKETKKLDLFDLSMPDKSGISLTQPSGIALESTVDPEKYFMGPSDVIAVNIWMSPPQSYALTVTPEGTLLVPTVGEIAVSDLTLAKAKEKVVREIRRKYLTAEITATLVKPRPIIVSVVGNVLNPGLFTLNAVDRANKAINEANKPTRTQQTEEVVNILWSMSSRNIVLKHKDGSQQRVDLQKYFGTRDEKWNPYLREGDIVIVPGKDPLKNVIAVYGQVNTNGRFEYVDGDSLADAIKIANGFTSRAMTERAIFSRLSEDGTSMTNTTINLGDVMNGSAPNIPLQPGDRIIVNAKPDQREDFNVDVRGEVKYPGTYPITRNHTHLSEVIQQAGGFTEFAALENAEVIRRSIFSAIPNEIERAQMLSMRGSASSTDTIGYSLEAELRFQQEAVTVDFKKLYVDKDSTQDIILQREDQLMIPSRERTVYVFGQVASPGHIPLIEGKEPKYYIEKAGGFTDHAEKGDVRVIKSKTKQWLRPGDTTLEPGDNIWVPAERDHPFSYYMGIASQTATILSVAIGVAILAVQVSK